MSSTPPSSSVRTEVPPAGTPSVSALMTLAVGVVVLGALYVGREVFVPLVLAVLLSFVMVPLVDLLRRWHFGRVPAVIASVFLALGIILSLGGIIGLQVAGLASDLPRYEQTVRAKISSLSEGMIGRLPDLVREPEPAGRGGHEGSAGCSAACRCLR